MPANKLFLSTATLLSLFTLAGCSDHRLTDSPDITLQNRSVTPVLAKLLPGASGGRVGAETIKMYSLLSSDDQLEQSPKYVFGGSADGAGIFQNPDGNYTILVNNEDNFAVSRITLDKAFKPVKGEYILNSDGGTWRLCSATLATPVEHGFGSRFSDLWRKWSGVAHTCVESGCRSTTGGYLPRGGRTGAVECRKCLASAQNSLSWQNRNYDR